MFHTRTSIINTALMRAGAPGVTAGFQDSPDAQTAEGAYDRVLAYCLGLFPWSFALRRVLLAQGAEAPGVDPVGGIHRYAYPLPADCLRVVNAHTDGGRVAAWEILGRQLLCDAAPVSLTYVRAGVPSFPDAFADMVAWRLAFEISPYMEQGGQARGYLEMFERALDRARVENDLESRPPRIVTSPFLQERRVD